MSASSGEKVAARLSPPDSINTRSRAGKRGVEVGDAARLMEASSRMAVCGQPPVSTPRMRSGDRAPERVRNSASSFGVDIVGDRGDVVTVAQALAQRIHQRSLAGADRPADADAQGSVGDVMSGTTSCTGFRGSSKRCRRAALPTKIIERCGRDRADDFVDNGAEPGDNAQSVGLTDGDGAHAGRDDSGDEAIEKRAEGWRRRYAVGYAQMATATG